MSDTNGTAVRPGLPSLSDLAALASQLGESTVDRQGEIVDILAEIRDVLTSLDARAQTLAQLVDEAAEVGRKIKESPLVVGLLDGTKSPIKALFSK